MNWEKILKLDYPDYIGIPMQLMSLPRREHSRMGDVYGIFSHVTNGEYTLEPGERGNNEEFWTAYQPHELSLTVNEAINYALLLDKPHLFSEYNTHEPLGLKIWGGRST